MSRGSITIRAARREDVPAILGIYNDAVLKITATYDHEPQTLGERITWYESTIARGFPVIVAEDPSGRIAGWGALGPFRAKEGYRYTAENSVYVEEGARGRGIGRRLLVELIEAGRKIGLHAIVAGIDSEAEVSIALHASLGFIEVGRLPQVGYKFDRWLDVVFMELLLQGADSG